VQKAPIRLAFHHSSSADRATPSQSAAVKAYMEAAERMHGPMMEAIQASDPLRSCAG